MAALDRMGVALRNQQEFTVLTDLTVEDVLNTGQKLQFGGTVLIDAKRPSSLRMMLQLGPTSRNLYYDGKSLTLYSPTDHVYATAKAPGTIRETLAAAEDEYGLFIPLTDLFLWGQDPAIANRVSSAFAVGREMIGGQMCEHYALRQPFVDWQVWIREGSNALPCKLVITTLDDPAKPQVTAIYNWAQNPSHEDGAFTFVPPSDAVRIEFQPLKAPQSSSNGK